MTERNELRAVERRVRDLVDGGATEADIAERFRRSPAWVRQVLELSEVPRDGGRADSQEVLRPVERCVLRWREDGVGYGDIAGRFRRGPGYIEQVERLAHYKLER